MEKIGNMFSWVLHECYKLCDLDYQEKVYLYELERRIVERQKKDEDFKRVNHEKLLKLIEEYPLERLRSMNKDQVEEMAQYFSELLRVSFFIYPNTKEYIEEIDLVRKRIARSDYPLAARFRYVFEEYVKDLYTRVVSIESEKNAKIRLSFIYK